MMLDTKTEIVLKQNEVKAINAHISILDDIVDGLRKKRDRLIDEIHIALTELGANKRKILS